MSQSPLNLALRFVLELIGLLGLFRLGVWLADGLAAGLLGLLLAVVAATAWASFNFPGDRSRSDRVPVAVPGPMRLLIELLLLGAGSAGWFLSGPSWLAWVYSVALVAHYLLSWDRVGWLLGLRSVAP